MTATKLIALRMLVAIVAVIIFPFSAALATATIFLFLFALALDFFDGIVAEKKGHPKPFGGFGTLFGVCSILIGLQPSAVLIAIGAFGMYFFLPIVNGCTEALWQTKTPADVQGRVFAIRRLIGASTVPAGYLIGGQLADKVFEPLTRSGGLSTMAGAGRGIGLMFIIGGILIMLAQLVAFLYTPLRRVEEDLPDAIVELSPSRA